MTERDRTTPLFNAARLAVAGVIIAGGALAMAGQASADPDVIYPTPAPGQPVVDSGDAAAVAAPAPPPVGPPMVPEMQNPGYGSGSGPLGFLRDAWNQAKNPYGVPGEDDALTPGGGAAPPPGAGPAPALPPGFVSLNAPGSETIAPAGAPAQGGPALPPGYYPLNGPPPPGYNAPAPVDPATPTTVVPVPPTP